MKKTGIFSLIVLLLGLLAFQAKADKMLEGAQLCTRHLPKAERYHNIPTHWLAAIASAESGRYHKRLGMLLPWPWTLNVNGKGYYFDNKREALQKIREYQAMGIEKIDVGCMQVNLHYHGHAFSSISEALEPRYNVAYAARFLRNNFDELRSWKSATAAYHSRTPWRGKKYFERVYDKWEKVIDRLGKGGDGEALMAEKPSPKRVIISGDGETEVVQHKPKHKSVRMKTIKVSDKIIEGASNQFVRVPEKSEYEKSRENGVLVTRVPPGARTNVAYNDTRLAERDSITEASALNEGDVGSRRAHFVF